MNDKATAAGVVRVAARAALWLHALVWLLFALAMIALAITSPESRQNPVFLQVTAAASVATIGSFGAVFSRRWGGVLAILGGLSVIAAWIAGDSGNELRLPVAGALALFALAMAVERRAIISASAR